MRVSKSFVLSPIETTHSHEHSTNNQTVSSNSSVELQLREQEKEEEEAYGISDSPPWSLVTLSGIQHLLAMIGGTVSIPYLLFPVYCVPPGDPARAELTCSLFFVTGITTILQSAIGARLPIMQGSTFSYIIPTFAILKTAQWKCDGNFTNLFNNSTETETTNNDWRLRISVVQGSLMISSLLEIFLGLTGLIGYLSRLVTPLAITPVLTMVGFALLRESLDYASGNWAISILTVVLLVIFSENMRNIYLPTVSYSRQKGFQKSRGIPIFQFFPVLLAIIVVWILCIILTEFNVFPPNDFARTDLSTEILDTAPWFRVPYPTQWGPPTYSVVAVVGMLGATVANIIEAIGNYYVCARISRAPAPPIHAVNRGVLIEGFGTFLEGLLGIGNGVSSYAENIGLIGMTHMASRKIMYVAGFLMILLGVLTKFGAVAMIIPNPIIGGVFIVLFSSIASVGLSNLQYVDMNSSRNLLTIGVPLFFGLAFPSWLKENPDSIQTGSEILDNILNVLLSTSMFLAGVLGILLDNVIPGTPEERGLVKWCEFQQNEDEDCKDYDLPFGNDWLKKCGCSKYIPILPGYRQKDLSCRIRKKHSNPTEISEDKNEMTSIEGLPKFYFNNSFDEKI